MNPFELIVPLLVFGVIIYIVLQVPVPGFVRNIIVAVAVLFLVLFVLQSFGIGTGLPVLRLK